MSRRAHRARECKWCLQNRTPLSPYMMAHQIAQVLLDDEQRPYVILPGSEAPRCYVVLTIEPPLPNRRREASSLSSEIDRLKAELAQSRAECQLGAESFELLDKKFIHLRLAAERLCYQFHNKLPFTAAFSALDEAIETSKK